MGIKSLFKKKLPYEDWPKDYAYVASDMAKAAGVGVARVRCHRNTWDYLTKEVPRHKRGGPTIPESVLNNVFRAPVEEDITAEADGLVTVPLSGSTLAAVLHFCSNIQDWPYRPNSAYNELDKAIGRRVGSAISQAMQNVVPATDASGATAVVYLDDKINAKDAA